MFTPKWKKEAEFLVKGARKFVNYKRDLLKPDRIDEIESRRRDLIAAIKSKDLEKVNEASKQLRGTCENSLKGQQAPTWWEENVEVMFVAIVIALGLRTYVLQPFRIPTGSMQPTLNGIVGTPLAEKEWPSLPTRMAEMALHGRSYVKVVNDRERTVAVDSNGRFIHDIQWWHFFSRSEISFTDGSSIVLPAPKSQLDGLGLSEAVEIVKHHRGVLPANTTLCEGTIDAGDLVLVDRISYNFRKPTRGEVFVFDTRGIQGLKDRDSEQVGTHFIKRLVGVPGDTLAVATPNLIVNGKVADEFGINRVAAHQGVYARNSGYGFADSREDLGRAEAKLPALRRYIDKPGMTLTLAKEAEPGMREYAAMGDNTGNSLDSRYWGPVKEFNLCGPAFVTLWPITTGHWGLIR